MDTAELCVLHHTYYSLCQENLVQTFSHRLQLLFWVFRLFVCLFVLVVVVALRLGFSVALELVLELDLVALNSQRSTCLSLPNAGIKVVHHHRPAQLTYF